MGKEQKQTSVSTLLGSDANMVGTIEFRDTIRLDGNVKGKIFSNDGTVVIGEKAIVDAEIVVETAIIMGEVNGTIDAKKRIEVYPPARVVGDIQAPTVLIESGVMFDGNCTMKERTVTSNKTPAPPKKLTFSKEHDGQ